MEWSSERACGGTGAGAGAGAGIALGELTIVMHCGGILCLWSARVVVMRACVVKWEARVGWEGAS